MKYLVTGTTIVDYPRFPDGTGVDNVLGGCGVYSYSGVRMLTDEVEFTAKTGEDFDEYFGEYFRLNNISTDYLDVVTPHLMRTRIEYRANGSYRAVPVPGSPSYDEAPELHCRTESFTKYFPLVEKGLYCFNNVRGAAEARDQYGFRIMLEGATGVGPEYRDELLEGARLADIYSLNSNECKDIFRLQTEEECYETLLGIGRPCFFRLGTKGAAMIADGRSYFVPIVHVTDHEKDPTGCGNSSTAAAMWAWFEGYDPLMTTCIANTVAAYNSVQFGPVPRFTKELRENIFKKAEEVYKENKNSYSVGL